MGNMSAFTAAGLAEAPKAQRVVTLALSAWVPTYRDKPEGDAQVGLRIPSQAELESARAEAAAKAWRLHPNAEDADDRLDARNGVLMALVVARGTCQPDDLHAPYFAAMADDLVPCAWTPGTIEMLFERIDLLLIEESPIAPALDDDGVAVLAEALRIGSAWAGVDTATAQRARRLLRYCADILGLELPDPTP